jgi:hypothetical protein
MLTYGFVFLHIYGQLNILEREILPPPQIHLQGFTLFFLKGPFKIKIYYFLIIFPFIKLFYKMNNEYEEDPFGDDANKTKICKLKSE